MSVTLTAGWWLLPLFVTIAAFGWAIWADRDNHPGPYGAGMMLSLIIYGVALVLSLIAWLIWALAS